MNLDYRSVPYRILENAYRIVGIVVISALFSTGDGGQGSAGSSGMDLIVLVSFVLLGLAAVAIWELAYVKRYEYSISPDTFDIYSGVFSRREREIPFDRIQNVDIAQNVFQRALGIAEVRLETAGGGETEARLRYVERQEATRIQEIVSERKHGESERDPGGSDDALFDLDSSELTVLGLTSANFNLFGLVVLLFVVLGTPVAAEQVSPRLAVLLFLGPALAAVALVVLWVLSGIQAVLRYYGFRLVRHEDELRYQRGLLQQYNGTIPLSKIQTLMIRENVIARAVGYGNLAIETAGYAPGQGSDDIESAIPIAKQARLFELARTIENFGEISFSRPPKRARVRYVGRYTIVVGILVALLGSVHLATGTLADWYLGVALWVLVPPAAHLKWANLGYYCDDNYVITRSGFWTRRTTIVPYYRVQTVSVSQTVFQRRRRLGTLVVDTASSGGFWGGNGVALDIDIEAARQLHETVHDRFQLSARERQTTKRRSVRPGD
ncbi:putative membrane protein [Halovenus aranensis]|jgi:putative membrane protein|uniref:Putative membrane protein n=1 Tax=Halovenus aranensis TaxID=890420 RepID=A0A1G8TFB7_9EURY|nr:PH domain-containing protein [Halovenus aranensis]SDJ40123.1 putative membrane protein [Halovenus aranensis]